MLVPHFVENIFRSGLTLVSSWDCFCQGSHIGDLARSFLLSYLMLWLSNFYFLIFYFVIVFEYYHQLKNRKKSKIITKRLMLFYFYMVEFFPCDNFFVVSGSYVVFFTINNISTRESGIEHSLELLPVNSVPRNDGKPSGFNWNPGSYILYSEYTNLYLLLPPRFRPVPCDIATHFF